MRNKFTLIEMLVIVAIIGILLTLLLPSLTNARTKAKETMCVSNLKQIYTGLMAYSRDNNNFLPRPTNFVTGRHWPKYIYESMTGTDFGSGDVSSAMQTSSYASVMYSPIVTGRRGSLSIHTMGRSDYGLNRFFLGDPNGDSCKQILQAEGQVEPLMMPIQGPANPALESTNLASGSKNVAYYYKNDSAAPALFLNGSFKYMSISEASSLDAKIWDKNTLE